MIKWIKILYKYLWIQLKLKPDVLLLSLGFGGMFYLYKKNEDVILLREKQK